MFKSKYIKYKTKYLQLIQQRGGVGKNDGNNVGVGDRNDEGGGGGKKNDGNDEGGGSGKAVSKWKATTEEIKKHVRTINISNDKPLIKLLFRNGFDESTISIPDLQEGLDRLQKLFMNPYQVELIDELIDELRAIHKSKKRDNIVDIDEEDEKISTIEKMQRSLDLMLTPMLPDKEVVKRFLICLYRKKIVSRATSIPEKNRSEKIDESDEVVGSAPKYTDPLLKPEETPLMKTLFKLGFNESTISIAVLQGGLDRLNNFFINEDKVSEIIDELKTIGIIDIDKKISAIKKIQESLNYMLAPMLPDKERVSTYLELLYRNKIIAREKLKSEKSK